MQPRNLAFACLLVLLLMPAASAEISLGYVGQEDQDVSIGYASANAAASAQFDLDLRRLQDLNGDGDFGDANEDVSLTNINNRATPDCNGNPEVSCTFTFASSDAFITWRNETANHRVGNYSITVVFENAIGGVIQRFRSAIRLTPQTANTTQLTTHDSSLQGHNQTMVAQHLSQNDNATGYNGTMVDGIGTLQNEHVELELEHNMQGLHVHANGTDSNSSRFTTDCHGTGDNLCVNGHVPVQIVQDWTVLALAVGIIIAFGWAATQRSTLLPTLAFFGGLGCILLLLANRSQFSSSTSVVDVVTSLAFLVMAGGGLSLYRYNTEKRGSGG